MMNFRPSINFARLNAQLEMLASVNRQEDGSCCRLALTDADRDGRDLVVSWMRDAGLEIQIDRIGNIFGVRAGHEAGPPVMTGSHIDTVATGGRYDGAYGVLAGLEVIRALNDFGVKTKRPIVLGIFTNEEGVRFQPDMMGSLVFAGGMALDEALAVRAEDGAILGDELARIGHAGSIEIGSLRPHAFVELHIEQGPVLDRANARLGAVENLQGISWKRITIRGTSNHAGTTPMNLRHDAGYCAARITTFLHDLAKKMGGSQVATVGSLTLAPNLVNVIARKAVLTVDLRNTAEEKLQEAENRLDEMLDELQSSEGVAIDCAVLARFSPVVFDDRIVALIENVARELQQPIRRMTSGAGHDAQMIARISPAAMIFVPSVAGVSHNPSEFTRPEDLENGANILLHTLVKLSDPTN
jgi:beta-ureidopropionase / N-carbamoyl-L-amino-acid hydrolase